MIARVQTYRQSADYIGGYPWTEGWAHGVATTPDAPLSPTTTFTDHERDPPNVASDIRGPYERLPNDQDPHERSWEAAKEAVTAAIEETEQGKVNRFKLHRKAQCIRRRCKLVSGKTILKAMKTQVPDKDGNMGKYKKADFKYDVAAGFITFKMAVGR